MAKVVNRARMTTATATSGTITLGSAVSGYQTFAAAGVANADVVSYCIEDGTAWEVGTGTYTTTGTTLSRTLVQSSTGSLLVLSGTAQVFITALAADLFPVPVSNGGSGAVTLTGVLKGNGTSAFTAATAGTDYMSPGTTSTITVGYTVTPNNLGSTITSFTANAALGNYQYGTNNAAFTLTAPTSDSAIDILITNGATAGAITFSGFTVGASPGSTYATTNALKFILSIRRINAISTYSWYALQ